MATKDVPLLVLLFSVAVPRMKPSFLFTLHFDVLFQFVACFLMFFCVCFVVFIFVVFAILLAFAILLVACFLLLSIFSHFPSLFCYFVILLIFFYYLCYVCRFVKQHGRHL